MTTSRVWHYGALAVVILAGMILTVPSGNAQSVESPLIEEMRLLVSWGDVDNKIEDVTTGTGTTWDGDITIGSGTLMVIRPLYFKDANDRLLNKEGETISFQTDLRGDQDGIFLRVFPQNGRDDEIRVTIKDDKTYTMALSSFLHEKEVTFTSKDGMAVRMKAEALILNRGSIRAQIQTNIGRLLKACIDQGKNETTCRAETLDARRGLETQQQTRVWSALQRELTKFRDPIWGKTQIHPDILFLLSASDLAEMTRDTLKRFDLSKLSHMTDGVYAMILRVAPERFAELPVTLQEDSQTYIEGVLPANIRTVGNLSEADFQKIKRLVASMDQSERRVFMSILLRLPVSGWDSVKMMDDDMLRSMATILLSVPGTQQEAALKAYARQANKLMNLKVKLNQLRSTLSVRDAQTLESMLLELQGTLLWTGDETPMVLTSIDTFLARSGALSREAMGPALRALTTEVQQALAENRVGLIKDGLGLFTDVPSTSWYAGFVGMMKADGLISGYKDKQGRDTGNYGPENPVTVAEVLKIALETAKAGTSTGTTLQEAANNHWAKGYVKRAEEMHLSITLEKSLDLNRPATRAEVVRTFIEAFGVVPPAITTTTFSDVYASMPYAAHIEYARSQGIVSGDDGKSIFRPADPINRAEAAKIAVKMQQVFRALFETSTVEGDITQ